MITLAQTLTNVSVALAPLTVVSLSARLAESIVTTL
jgi:hypothetical protein